jgi:hypothetical protein
VAALLGSAVVCFNRLYQSAEVGKETPGRRSRVLIRRLDQALPPGHPALQEPLQFLTALDGLLRSLVDPDELERLREEAARELQDPGRWGLDFTLVQCWGQRRT